MRYLLDSCTLLWATQNPKKLSPRLREVLENPEAVILVSAVSLWELSIKKSVGKLELPNQIESLVERYGFELLPLSLKSINRFMGLPWHHKDPFDRILIATAQAENLTICTTDKEFQKYEVALLS